MPFAAIFAPLLAPYGAKDATFAQYLPPSAEFPMGTDQIGRDILSRVVWGARLSLYVGLVSVAFGITLGALWGIITAYFGGLADSASQRVVDVLMALPPIVLALSLMAALGQSVNNVIMALAILLTPTAARTLRSVALSIKESPYVEAARAAGCSHWRIILGGMLTAGTQAMETAPWMIWFPGLAISLTVFGLNLLGDAIRDVTDPRLRGGLG
ncbi:MAG: ABC transporter permease [Candidatus Rokubacteria bacterium]|nr:ABC transporter permease [Candidatus Rokubacteria bacterium]